MKSISGKQLCKLVEQKGWILQRVTGSHHIYANLELKQILSIPRSSQSRFKDWNFESFDEQSPVI